MMRLARVCGCCLAFLSALTMVGDRLTFAQPLGFSEEHLLLESSGVTTALLDQLAAGKPVADDDRAAQLTVLSALRQVTQFDLDRYADKPKTWSELTDGRGSLWQVRGKLESVTPIDLTDAELEKLYPEFDELKPDDPRRKIYRCEFRLEDAGADAPKGAQATLVALRMPEKLLPAKTQGEAIGVQGLLVKNAGTAEAPHPVFFVRRPAWHPDTYLGKLGMDYGLYDDVRDVTDDLKYEHEALYRLLATMAKADQTTLAGEATANYDKDAKSFSVVPLFNAPESIRGKLVTIEGTARRAVAVRVAEPDVQERFGIKKYYEVALYTADSQQNPILVDLLELPPDFPQGENIHELVKIPGTFLTGFYYKRDATPDEQSRGIKPELQKAPLLVGKSLQFVPKPTASNSYFQWLFGLAVAAAFVVLIIAVWRMSRSEHRTRDIRLRAAEAEAKSLNDANIEVQGPPDFSKLDERN